MRPLGVQVYALAYRSGVPWNETGFANEEFDALLTEAYAIADADKRRVVMEKMEKIIQDFGHHHPALLALDLPPHDRGRERPRHASDLRDPPGGHLAGGLSPLPCDPSRRLRRDGSNRGGRDARLPPETPRRDGADRALPDADRLRAGQPQAEPGQARQGADRQPHHRAAGRGLARPERLQPAADGALRRVAGRRGARRLRPLHPLQRAGRRRALAAALADRDPDVLGDGGDGPLGAPPRHPRRHARGLGAGPRALHRRHRHHLDAGIRLRRGADGDLRQPDGRAAVVFRLGHQGGRGRPDALHLRPAGADHRHLRHGLHRADDPRLDGRGDDAAVHPHRAAQGRELPRDRAEATRSATR